MKKLMIICLFGLLISSCGSDQKTNQSDLEAKHRALIQRTIQKNAVIADYRSYLNNLGNKIELMLKKEMGVNLLTDGVSGKDAMIHQLEQLDELLDNQRYKLAMLEEGVRAQTLSIGSLKVDIQQMEEALNQRQDFITTLQAEICDDKIMISMLDHELQLKDDSLIMKENELNKAWFAYGTYEELLANDVVEKRGGLLGIGAVKSLKSEFNPEYFTEVDISSVREIPILASKAQLVSNHPECSYEFVGKNEVSSLVINDPEEFWKLSRHLAIIVK